MSNLFNLICTSDNSTLYFDTPFNDLFVGNSEWNIKSLNNGYRMYRKNNNHIAGQLVTITVTSNGNVVNEMLGV